MMTPALGQKSLRAIERQARAKAVAHLREIQRRELWKTHGFKSIKEFCMTDLHYDETETRELLIAIGVIVTRDQMTDPNPQVQKRIEALKAWRKKTAIKTTMAADLVLSNRMILSIAKEDPKTVEELAQIRGFGAKKIRSCGKEILQVIDYKRF